MRAPVFALATLLAGYVTRSASTVDPVRVPAGIGFYGARAYFLLPATALATSDFRFLGWDIEVAYVVLGRDQIGRTASDGVAIAPELRLRIGRAQILSPFNGSQAHQLTLGLDLAGGFSWFL